MIMGHVGDTDGFFLSGKKSKNISLGHVGNMAFLPRQKTHITAFRALGSLAFDSAYDIK